MYNYVDMAVARFEQYGISIGLYMPDQVITNKTIASWNVTSQSGKKLKEEDILKRTGIKERRVGAEWETIGYMAKQASMQALGDSQNIDLVLAATSYPTGTNLAYATREGLNLPNCPVMEIGAACSGFTRGLNYLFENRKDFDEARVLFVTSEKYSPTLAPLKDGGSKTDPSLAQTLFSDGAVAMVFTFGKNLSVLSSSNFKFPNEYSHLIKMPINRILIKQPYIEEEVCLSEKYFEQDGKKVFDAVIRNVPTLVLDEIRRSSLETSDIRWVIPHQGSGHMVDALGRLLQKEELAVFEDYREGNLSSASVPKALMSALSVGSIERGDNLVLAGFGAGIFASTSVVKVG
jgi:3-oxoacyl-[acyl-carrier-protein] synthase III